AEFGAPSTSATSSFSNVNRGVHGVNYRWNSRDIYDHARTLQHALARIPFRWERIQPLLGGPLDPVELSLMTASVDDAIAAGLQVILDVHNYGAYYKQVGTQGVRYAIGTAEVTFDHFADLWRRLAEVFNTRAGVLGYGLMNEPVDMTPIDGMTTGQTWARAAQQATDAIRGVALPSGASPKWILVGGYRWSGTWSLAAHHNGPFIVDAADRVIY